MFPVFKNLIDSSKARISEDMNIHMSQYYYLKCHIETYLCGAEVELFGCVMNPFDVQLIAGTFNH